MLERKKVQNYNVVVIVMVIRGISFSRLSFLTSQMIWPSLKKR